MLNLYLIQVSDKYGPNSFLPLAISYQWLYAQTDLQVKENFEVVDVLIDKKPIKDYVNSLDKHPDVIAMSCYIWNWEYNKMLAIELKAQYPECIIVVGGPHIDKNNPDFFLKYPQFDVAVLGEGELAFQQILLRIAHKQGFHGIPNTFSKTSGFCEQPQRMKNLDSIPSPILTGFYDWIIDKVEKEKGKQMWQVTYETLRGCPYSCTFCDIGDEYWNKITKFELDRIFAEIDWMAEKKIEYVSMCDSNWGMLKRDKEITEYVIDKKQKTGYPKLWDATWAKSNNRQVYEIAKMDHDAGTELFRGVTISVQTLNNKTEESIKRKNIKNEKLFSYIDLYRKEGIPTYTEIIWPMPDETYQSFVEGIQKLVDMGQKNWIAINALQITYNAEMGQHKYLEQHGMKCNETILDTFHVTIDNINEHICEKTFHVYETNSASKSDVLQGHLFSYLFVLLYCHGWAYFIMEYMQKKYEIRETDFVQSLLNYFCNSDSLIGEELAITKNLLEESLNGNRFWGRQLHDKDQYWDYKGASSLIFHRNRDRLYTELELFLKRVYNINAEQIVEFNKNMFFDYRTNYPVTKTFDTGVLKFFTGLETNTVKIDHDYSYIDNEEEFANMTFNYRRKKSFWKCKIN